VKDYIRKFIRKYGTQLAKKNVLIRRIIRTLMNWYRIIKFKFHTRGIKVNPKVVIFNSFNGKSYSDTPKAVYEYMLAQERFKDYRFIWVFKEPTKYQWLKENKKTYIVKDKSVQYERALAKARYWICNYRIYDYVYPKKNQFYIQCWHGTPLKRLGYDIEHSNNAMNSSKEIQYKYRTDAEKFKYILSPSAFSTEKFASAWNLNKTGQRNKLIELGYPRDDFMLNYTKEDVTSIKENLKIPEDKKVLLYAPTWRDNQHTSGVGYVYSTEVDFSKLQEKLGDEWIILFRAHYLVANSFDFEQYQGFVYDASDYDDINQLYVISDLLITDYSSVFFDYATLNRPMIFYMYDLQYYGEDLRGFYIDLKELPGPIVEDEDTLLDKIIHLDSWFSYDEKYQKFNKKYNALNDGKASARFVERVFGNE
jgi:CDP-glycerol glycerophosphotransferase